MSDANPLSHVAPTIDSLTARLDSLESHPFFLGVGETQANLCRINTDSFLPMDRLLIVELHEVEGLQDMTILLKDEEEYKMNSFLASMLSGTIRRKYSTPVGHLGRNRVSLPDVSRHHFETLINLTLSTIQHVHPRDLEALVFLADSLEFPTAVLRELHLRMDRVLGLDVHQMATELDDISRENSGYDVEQADAVQPRAPLPRFYGFEDRVPASAADMTPGHYYGILDPTAQLHLLPVIFASNRWRAQASFLSRKWTTPEPFTAYSTLPSAPWRPSTTSGPRRRTRRGSSIGPGPCRTSPRTNGRARWGGSAPST